MTINEMLSAIPVWPKMTTINTQFEMLRFFGFEIHTDLATQNRIASFMDVCDKIERVLCEGTEKRKDLKKYMSKNMFPA